MHGRGNRIYGFHVIIHNGVLAECKVIDNFRGLRGPRTRTRTCKLILKDKDKDKDNDKDLWSKDEDKDMDL